MKPLTKKRLKAIAIDSVVSSAVSLSIEAILRRKIKNEAFHTLVTPTVALWGLEILQLRCKGQTVGMKAMGLELVGRDGGVPSTKQLAKRVLYRDSVSTMKYIKDRKAFEGADGSALPHDLYAGCEMREK